MNLSEYSLQMFLGINESQMLKGFNNRLIVFFKKADDLTLSSAQRCKFSTPGRGYELDFLLGEANFLRLGL